VVRDYQAPLVDAVFDVIQIIIGAACMAQKELQKTR
jgi:hypothetical protein